MLKSTDPLAGFNGAAMGFTVGKHSMLAISQIIRNISSMNPKFVEQALGYAFTKSVLVEHGRKAKDIYFVAYRGDERIEVDAANPSRIKKSEFRGATGEVMWRRIRIDPEVMYQAEVRGVGGYAMGGPVVGVKFQVEKRQSRYKTIGFGGVAAYSTIDPWSFASALLDETKQMSEKHTNLLLGFNVWQEDKARDSGFYFGLNFLYSRIEQLVYTNLDGTPKTDISDKDKFFASALMLYYAKKHNFLVGFEKVPGWTNVYQAIDNAMRDMRMNPENEATILSTLRTGLEEAMKNDIYRAAIGYGYDGRKLGVYVFGGGQLMTGADELQTYAGLKSIFVFGRPAKAFLELGGYGYLMPRTLITETFKETGELDTLTTINPNKEYIDFTLGVGSNRYPHITDKPYKRTMTLLASPDIGAALRDAYMEFGLKANTRRLENVYGRSFASVMAAHAGEMTWMLRPQAEIKRWLQTKLDGDEGAVYRIMNTRDDVPKADAKVRDKDASAVIDIFINLRRGSAGRRYLATKGYRKSMISAVEAAGDSLSFMLLPPEKIREGFRARAKAPAKGRKQSPENRIAEAAMPKPVIKEKLTGGEARKLLEGNIVDAAFGCMMGKESKDDINPRSYDVVIAKHLLADPKAEHSTFFVRFVAGGGLRPEAVGRIEIGDSTDRYQWTKQRTPYVQLDLRKEGGDYHATFLGDRRTAFLGAWKLRTGMNIPIRPSEFRYWDPERNLKGGAIIQILKRHNLEIITNILYGRAQTGYIRYEQATFNVTGEYIKLDNSAASERYTGYLFFNHLGRSVYASKNVFKKPDELREVCQKLGANATCTTLDEYKRITGGIGLNYYKINYVTGSSHKFDVFLEAGAMTRMPMVPEGTVGLEVARKARFPGSWPTYYTGKMTSRTSPVFAIGAAYERKMPNANWSWFFGVAGGMGVPLNQLGVPGSILQPNLLNAYDQSALTYKDRKFGWFLINAGIKFE
ncbi:MAG: hypothetical protein V1827_06270 [Candidatus Micrarchaeota archaeon]